MSESPPPPSAAALEAFARWAQYMPGVERDISRELLWDMCLDLHKYNLVEALWQIAYGPRDVRLDPRTIAMNAIYRIDQGLYKREMVPYPPCYPPEK